jgi:hypothetical protein
MLEEFVSFVVATALFAAFLSMIPGLMDSRYAVRRRRGSRR